MKKTRKEALIYCFPAVDKELMDKMKGKGAKNYVVFLTRGAELFARCFHRYSTGDLVERQRYVFARDGSVRYGSDNGINWAVRNDFREPVFCKCCMGYNYDNSYSVLNIKAIDKSDMRYSQHQHYHGNMLICYLHAYCKHPNLEYLMKQDYDVTSVRYTGWWGYQEKFLLSQRVNWKSNDLLKMLGLNKTEFKTLKGSEHLWEQYLDYREEYPKLRPEDLLNIAKVFKNEHGTLERLVRITGLTPQRVARYIHEQKMTPLDYSDYLEQCETLEYNIHDTMIALPHDFWTMHNRLTQIINYEHDELVLQNFTKRLAGKCVKVTAEIVCDVIFAVRHSACTAEAVHNGAYLAVNAGLNFFAIYRTLTLADRSALINNANFYVFVKLDKFVCHEYAGCTCTDNNYVIILSHNYFLSNQNPIYFYP